METTFAFTAYNAETSYGFGTEAEAQRYLDWLNINRKINLFEKEISGLTDAQADTLAFNLRDCLSDLESFFIVRKQELQ